MKKNHLFRRVIPSAFLFCFLIIAGCSGGGGGGGSTASLPGYVFQDNFDSYTPTGTWTPAGGWTSTSSDRWAVVNPGLTGNGIEFIARSPEFLLSSYTGNDYTVTVRARSTTIVPGWGFGILARYDNNDNCYAMGLFNNNHGPGNEIAIYKFWNNGASNNAVITGAYLATDLNTSTYYTLTLKVSGTTPTTVTATITDGVTSQTIAWTDNLSYGPVIPSGKAGIWLYTGVAYPVIYDNFTVTVP